MIQFPCEDGCGQRGGRTKLKLHTPHAAVDHMPDSMVTVVILPIIINKPKPFETRAADRQNVKQG